MPSIGSKRNYSKTSKTPRRPYEKERLDQELKLLGEYGLRCKREIWRVQLALAKIRKAARELLTLDPKDPKRVFEGPAILRKMQKYGLIGEEEKELDFVLQLSTGKLLERRLQTKVFRSHLAKSIHHARVLIKQRHIRVGKQVVNVPSFLVRVDSEKHIDFSATSPYSDAGRKGRVARKNAAAKKGDGDGDDE